MSRDKELFLDLLNKEEKEALLVKKMEDIRKKNELLRKRHEEVEADKKRALEVAKATAPPPSPQHSSPGVEYDRMSSATYDRGSDSHSDRGRGRGRGGGGRGGRGGRGRGRGRGGGAREWDDDGGHERVGWDGHDRQRGGSNQGWGGGDNDDGGGRERYDRQHSVGRGGRRGHQHRGGGGGGMGRDRGDREDGDMNHDRTPGGRGRRTPHQGPDSHSWTPDHERRDMREGGDLRDRLNRKKTEDGASPRKQGGRTPMDYGARRKQNAAEFEAELMSPDGPPPDPGYSFLSDRSRAGPAREQREASRRHVRNYGGKDFNEVKTKIKVEKDRQMRYRQAPRSKMEMTVSMTGRERREYQEWKAERDSIDRARLDRQKKQTGEWRRAWDTEKEEKELEFSEVTPPRKVEPGRRPAGRIGSGRFDRGERDDRQRGEAPGVKGVRSPGTPGEEGVPRQPFSISPREGERGRGRGGGGRGRGGRGGAARGGGRGGGGGRSPSQRDRTTSSGSEEGNRHVQQNNDKLIIQVENEFHNRKKRGPKSPLNSPGASPSSKPDLPPGGTTADTASAPPSGETRAPSEPRLPTETDSAHEKQSSTSAQGETSTRTTEGATETLAASNPAEESTHLDSDHPLDPSAREGVEEGYEEGQEYYDEYHDEMEKFYRDQGMGYEGEEGGQEWGDSAEAAEFYEVGEGDYYVEAGHGEDVNSERIKRDGDQGVEPATPTSSSSQDSWHIKPPGDIQVLDWAAEIDRAERDGEINFESENDTPNLNANDETYEDDIEYERGFEEENINEPMKTLNGSDDQIVPDVALADSSMNTTMDRSRDEDCEVVRSTLTRHDFVGESLESELFNAMQKSKEENAALAEMADSEEDYSIAVEESVVEDGLESKSVPADKSVDPTHVVDTAIVKQDNDEAMPKALGSSEESDSKTPESELKQNDAPTESTTESINKTVNGDTDEKQDKLGDTDHDDGSSSAQEGDKKEDEQKSSSKSEEKVTGVVSVQPEFNAPEMVTSDKADGSTAVPEKETVPSETKDAANVNPDESVSSQGQ